MLCRLSTRPRWRACDRRPEISSGRTRMGGWNAREAAQGRHDEAAGREQITSTCPDNELNLECALNSWLPSRFEYYAMRASCAAARLSLVVQLLPTKP